MAPYSYRFRSPLRFRICEYGFAIELVCCVTSRYSPMGAVVEVNGLPLRGLPGGAIPTVCLNKGIEFGRTSFVFFFQFVLVFCNLPNGFCQCGIRSGLVERCEPEAPSSSRLFSEYFQVGKAFVGRRDD